ncbi:hypothetical protein HNO86_27985 [Pseudomonas sp. C1C7]|uniref:hypothetical protein n=1 Tax=Pseudomonas sp. C1C7 TaxID=2735272 RepID=UPI001586D215|nr:hypothetical protein [Pseudomonas sp. C1C7]NUT78888.1 hypothetical protein [Pseudomonas sp. C1C7]
MNALKGLYIVSHPLRISRYGAHTSLSTAERVEVIEALTDTLGTALTLLAQLKCGQQKLRNVSFLPVQQLFNRLVRANTLYVDFLASAIGDLGGHAETEALYQINDILEPACFADCMTGIARSARRLRAVDTLLRDYRECAIDRKDPASRRLFEDCTRHNAHFLTLIEDHLTHEQS